MRCVATLVKTDLEPGRPELEFQLNHSSVCDLTKQVTSSLSCNSLSDVRPSLLIIQ